MKLRTRKEAKCLVVFILSDKNRHPLPCKGCCSALHCRRIRVTSQTSVYVSASPATCSHSLSDTHFFHFFDTIFFHFFYLNSISSVSLFQNQKNLRSLSILKSSFSLTISARRRIPLAVVAKCWSKAKVEVDTLNSGAALRVDTTAALSMVHWRRQPECFVHCGCFCGRGSRVPVPDPDKDTPL